MSAVAAESMNASFTSRNHLRRCLQAMSLTEKIRKQAKKEGERARATTSETRTFQKKSHWNQLQVFETVQESVDEGDEKKAFAYTALR